MIVRDYRCVVDANHRSRSENDRQLDLAVEFLIDLYGLIGVPRFRLSSASPCPLRRAHGKTLFQTINQRFELGSTVITNNRVSKCWPEIFNNECTVSTAIRDRPFHHTDTVRIEDKSFHMND